MTESETLSALAKGIAESYLKSEEYERLTAIVAAIRSDPVCQSLLGRLKECQRICRDTKTDLTAKREAVKQVYLLKETLHQEPLWVNYLEAKASLASTDNALLDALEGE